MTLNKVYKRLLGSLCLLVFIPFVVIATLAFVPVIAFGKLVGAVDMPWWEYFTTFWRVFLHQ